jgi:DNA-binding CsgD family transcriptional regulator
VLDRGSDRWSDGAECLAQSLLRLSRVLTAAERELHQARDAYEALLGELVDRGHAGDSAVPTERLTAQERRVGALIVLGKTNRQIADLLSVSPETARSHVKSIMAKLDLRSRWQLHRTLGVPDSISPATPDVQIRQLAPVRSARGAAAP